jgi:hypothetical protein
MMMMMMMMMMVMMMTSMTTYGSKYGLNYPSFFPPGMPKAQDFHIDPSDMMKKMMMMMMMITTGTKDQHFNMGGVGGNLVFNTHTKLYLTKGENSGSGWSQTWDHIFCRLCFLLSVRYLTVLSESKV